jgi:hypothetical protein
MKAANVFIGVAEGAVAAAVVADSIAEAKAMLPGLDVIKMTSKTRLFVAFPSFGNRKKALISGATKVSKGASLPQARVTVIKGRIEFFAAIYIDGMPVRECIYMHFPAQPTGDAACRLCK